MEIIIFIIVPYVFSKVYHIQRNLNTKLIRKILPVDLGSRFVFF